MGSDYLLHNSKWIITTALLAGVAFGVSWWAVQSISSAQEEQPHANTEVVPAVAEPGSPAPAVIPPIPEIPRPVAASPGLAEAVSPQIKPSKRLQVLMRGGLVLGTDERDRKAAFAQFLDAREGDALRNETLNLLLRDAPSERVLEAIEQVIAAPYEEARFRSFAVQGLGRLHRRFAGAGDDRASHTATRLHELINHPEEESRREAVWALVEAGDERAATLLRRCLAEDEGRGFVDLAIRLVRQEDDRQALPRIRELASSPDHATAVAAIEALGYWADADSRDLLATIASEGPTQRRPAARFALQRLDRAVEGPPTVGSEATEVPADDEKAGG